MRREISMNGNWQFAYTQTGLREEEIRLPADKNYEVSIPVPAYWDDCRSILKYTKFWSRDCVFNPEYREIEFPMGGQKPPDASLPYLIGTGWYRKRFPAREDWKEKTVVLHVGSVAMEAKVWLNGQYLGGQESYGLPFDILLNGALKYGEKNELVIGVSNTDTKRKGCNIRGYKGRSAGITGEVSLQITEGARISDCYVRTTADMDRLIWQVNAAGAETLGRGHGWEESEGKREFTVKWQIKDKEAGVLGEGFLSAKEGMISWTTGTFGMRPWSDREPMLYRLNITLWDGERVLDRIEQDYGMRFLQREGGEILLNGQAVYLRGATDHAYFPETCTVPRDFGYYYKRIKILKALGFNWVRFHTAIPPEESMQAADLLGMMIQTETPNGFSEADFLNMIALCRRHPSVILYCCGNEVPITEAVNEKLRRMSGHCHVLAPDVLFNPMEALREIEFDVDEKAEGYVPLPIPHNAKKLAEVRDYSDVIAPAVWVFSYHSLFSDMEKIEERLSIYQRPCLVHEAGINDSYLNLDLEKRYEGTRIGTDLYRAAREYLTEMGMIKNAPVYYQNSCKWMRQIIKYTLEKARRCKQVSGYDFLGAVDCHWHRTGYAVGMLNEFYELKPGFTVEDVREFNGESVLLSDSGLERNLIAGEELKIRIQVSLYGKVDVDAGALTWYFEDEDGNIYGRGRKEIGRIPKGGLRELAELSVEAPEVKGVGGHFLFKVRLEDEHYELSNQWDYWVFSPDMAREKHGSEKVRVVKELSEEDIAYMEAGGRALLLGSAGLPVLPVTFQMMSGGRTSGVNGTVIHAHPLMRDFPQDGFCDWQFYSMLEGGSAVVFNDLDIAFRPVIEIVSTYKYIKKQAGVFEIKVGEGGMLVNTLQMERETPACIALYNRMLEYLGSEEFCPKEAVSAEGLRRMLAGKRRREEVFENDECYDAGGLV